MFEKLIVLEEHIDPTKRYPIPELFSLLRKKQREDYIKGGGEFYVGAKRGIITGIFLLRLRNLNSFHTLDAPEYYYSRNSHHHFWKIPMRRVRSMRRVQPKEVQYPNFKDKDGGFDYGDVKWFFEASSSTIENGYHIYKCPRCGEARTIPGLCCGGVELEKHKIIIPL
jgi:hypothetical protein